MDINKMLAELREEREGIEQAIMVLQRLSAPELQATLAFDPIFSCPLELVLAKERT
jgi:hypothetical protein